MVAQTPAEFPNDRPIDSCRQYSRGRFRSLTTLASMLKHCWRELRMNSYISIILSTSVTMKDARLTKDERKGSSLKSCRWATR